MGKEEKKKLPGRILAGYILMGIACLLMIAAAGYLIYQSVVTPLRYQPGEGEPKDYFSVRSNFTYFVSWIVIAALFLLSAVSGFSYIFHWRFLVQIVGLVAILNFVTFIVTLVLCCTYYSGPLSFFYDFMSTSFPGFLYFVGWFMAKDYFDD